MAFEEVSLAITMTLALTALSVSIVAAILATVAFIYSLKNYVANEAIKKSTHQVQLVPVDELGQPVKLNQDGFQELTEEEKQKLTRDPFEAL